MAKEVQKRYLVGIFPKDSLRDLIGLAIGQNLLCYFKDTTIMEVCQDLSFSH